ncbi:MAG: hypothetical protein PVH89_04225 [Gammaproteobacteria bacterium]|jgi:hypothetical protein
MKRSAATGLILAACSGLAASSALAHFKLLEPASWIEEDDRGDPQKLGPCGGTIDNPGTRSGAVTEVQGGSLLKVVVDETIYHPGHFRISLARRPNWLPPDPVATMKETERGPRSDRAEIQETPEPPVLVDGIWEHYERRTGIWETEVEIPNIDCEGCFLQVIQFMSEHPGFREGGFSYHHCAVLNITADDGAPVDDRW